MSESNILTSDNEKEKNDAKMVIVSKININCQILANNYFECLESKYREIDFRYKRSIEEIERISNEEFVPECMKKFNLEDCLEANKPRKK